MAWFAPMGFVGFSLGTAMVVGGLLLAALGYAGDTRGAWIVALIAGGQALTLGSVSFLGEDRQRRLAARAGVGPVSDSRGRLGMAFLVLHVAVYFCVWTVAVLAYARANDEDPFPQVFGLSFEQQGPVFVWGVVVAELLFWVAIYALGPSWWQRFTKLFRYQAPSETAVSEAPKAPPTFRYRLGLAVFAVGNVLAVGGLLLPALGLAKGRMVGVIAVMLAAGEVLSLSSIFFLGKAGFKQLKSTLFAALKRKPPGESISQLRHRVGCTFLAVHVVLQFAALAFPIASHYGVTDDRTFPIVLGLSRQQQLQWFIGLLAAAEVFFFAGVYALGADWWGRFQALFKKEP